MKTPEPSDAAAVAEWVTLEDVAGIIRAAAQGAANKGGLTECSAVALNSWAEVIERNLALLRHGVQDGGENAAVIATVLNIEARERERREGGEAILHGQGPEKPSGLRPRAAG